jgi:hypothetical protein
MCVLVVDEAEVTFRTAVRDAAHLEVNDVRSGD